MTILQNILLLMRQPNNNRYQHTQELPSKSRKQLRKEKKQQKKAKKIHFFQSKSQPLQSMPNKNKPINKIKQHPSDAKSQGNKINSSTHVQERREKQIKTKDKKIKQRPKQQTQDDKMIRLYEQKLGMSQGKDRYDKIAKKFGFDDDIFDFLDGISKKAKATAYSYNAQAEEVHDINESDSEVQQQNLSESEQLHEDQLQQEYDDEFNEMFDNLDEMDIEQEQDQQQDELIEEQQDDHQQQDKQAQVIPKWTRKTNKTETIKKQEDAKPTTEDEAKFQLKKSMNSLLNKLSDGNVLLTFREFSRLFDSHSKAIAIPIYAELFVKFNLIIEKPLFHILATNIALLSALHYTYGNRLLGPVLHTLSTRYTQLDRQQQNEAEVMEIGYSKRFERMKNYSTIVSLLYNYGSISAQFVQSYVSYLTSHLNKNNIELIYIIIQKCGTKIRQNDPSTLKNIIATIKSSIETYKNATVQEEQQKIRFIQLQINEIRFNKKTQNTTDQRMMFLQTFIFKNVRAEIQKQLQVFPQTFQAVLKADTSFTNWWGLQQQAELENPNEQSVDQQLLQITEEKRKLIELAKSFHMVTETKRNIFICIMDSKDYLQATQRILDLKVRNLQDVATVIVEICTLEPSFNPYYPVLAGKLASLNPKFRLNIQYAIWDHLKLLETYELRRTSNLAKFTAKLISDSLSNCSLSILKFFPDLSSVNSIEVVFLNIFFNYFFTKVSQEYLCKLVAKLREENNRDIKMGIKQYLTDFQCEQKFKDKVKLCKRLLILELDERKQQMRNDLV